MYKKITFNMFCDEFVKANRNDNFSYDAKEAIFNDITYGEQDCDIGREIDIIEICCEYTEYEDFEDYCEQNGIDEYDYTMRDLERDEIVIKFGNCGKFLVRE